MLRQQNCFQALILWIGWKETIPITCSHSVTASQPVDQTSIELTKSSDDWLRLIEGTRFDVCEKNSQSEWMIFFIRMNDCPLKLDDMFGDILVKSISKKNPKMHLENWTVSENNSSIYMFLVCVCTFVNLSFVQVYVCLFFHLFVSLCVCSFVRSLFHLFVCLFVLSFDASASVTIHQSRPGLPYKCCKRHQENDRNIRPENKSKQMQSYLWKKKNCSLINLWHIKSWNLL